MAEDLFPSSANIRSLRVPQGTSTIGNWGSRMVTEALEVTYYFSLRVLLFCSLRVPQGTSIIDGWGSRMVAEALEATFFFIPVPILCSLLVLILCSLREPQGTQIIGGWGSLMVAEVLEWWLRLSNGGWGSRSHVSFIPVPILCSLRELLCCSLRVPQGTTIIGDWGSRSHQLGSRSHLLF